MPGLLLEFLVLSEGQLSVASHNLNLPQRGQVGEGAEKRGSSLEDVSSC